MEQAVEQIYLVKLNKRQNNVTNDGSTVLGNGGETGSGGQLGKNGGTGGSKQTTAGTQLTHDRGGVDGDDQKGKGAKEEPLTPPTGRAKGAIDDFAKKMTGKGVNLVDSPEKLPKSEGTAYRAIKDGARVMGWFNIKTGQVYIYTPNARNYNEVMKTLLHEFVAHKGLRNMLGAKEFDKLCRDVWKMMPYDQRLQYAV